MAETQATPKRHRNLDLYDFSSIALSLASPDKIMSRSYGEISKPETINYRTQRPEPDGLFCEKIFGPTKNWECYCGKYKKIKYKGIICEKCGVEVTRSVVRRERMGHINLAVPIAHNWFLRSTPSRIGLILDLSIRQLEQIVGFSSYIIQNIDEQERKKALKELATDFENTETDLKEQMKQEIEDMQTKYEKKEVKKEDLNRMQREHTQKLDDLVSEYEMYKNLLETLEIHGTLSEIEYVRLRMRFGHVFEAGIGAEALHDIINKIDLQKLHDDLQNEIKNASGAKQQKLYKRIKFISGLMRTDLRPEWMIFTTLPVLPPDLRPMVALDGGRYAASDLNDLYRRVINRNNRLRRLLEIGAPEVICRNEKRMLQEAVDALINNAARSGRGGSVGDRRKYKSLSDMLKGKQGRFRQNLLGKRVDYSGRSVIVVNPSLRMEQCGLPKKMALELFKPFVLGKLVSDGIAHNVKYAERMIEWNRSEIWDALEEVTKDHYVLLNRAPTLHRLGVQAFKPLLIEGNAIQIHPLVCAAFNADFDGDQMAVHIPLSDKAQKEAKELMLSTRNILKPADAEPIINPSQDMILGCYFLTMQIDDAKGAGMAFASFEEAKYANDLGYLDYQAPIKVRYNGSILETTYGRLLFNRVLPKEIGYKNYTFAKGQLKKLIAELFENCGIDTTTRVTDDIKDFGFKYASVSGLTMSMYDFIIPETKSQFVDHGNELVEQINRYYRYGLLTTQERYMQTINVWNRIKRDVENDVKTQYEKNNPIYTMVDSGARANWGNITQVAGMKGLVANPSGQAIEIPIKSSLKEGFTTLEYFIGTHGGRKGKADTALKTASAGYLTRRLVDAVQDVIVREEDCGSVHGDRVHVEASNSAITESFDERIWGRFLQEDVVHPESGEVIAARNTFIDRKLSQDIANSGVGSVLIRSVMTCHTVDGVCQKCYGADLSNHQIVKIGEPVGIIGAQSIGEPGTQLTMRTFHMGGVASEEKDITSGLERVEELFECRNPKTKAIMAEIDGKVNISQEEDTKIIEVVADDRKTVDHRLFGKYDTQVNVGDKVKEKATIAKMKKGQGKGSLRAKVSGEVAEVNDDHIMIKEDEKEVKRYTVSTRESVTVEDGADIKAGTPLTLGHLNLRDLFRVSDGYSVQKYIIDEVYGIYSAQGQSISPKHIEVITRQMLSKVSILDPGDTEFLTGEVVSVLGVLQENMKMQEDGKREAHYEHLLLGLTKTAINTDSWLSAASFQETVRVLIEAAVTRKVDDLRGLKENVIIGRLLPVGNVYRNKYENNEIPAADLHDPEAH